MSKTEAVRELIQQACTERMSKAALNRLRQACKALNLNDEETATVEKMLQYRDREGKLYSRFE